MWWQFYVIWVPKGVSSNASKISGDNLEQAGIRHSGIVIIVVKEKQILLMENQTGSKVRNVMWLLAFTSFFSSVEDQIIIRSLYVFVVGPAPLS